MYCLHCLSCPCVQLWGVALRALKGVLEPAFELQLSTAPQMLMVKEFVVLMCVALERAGHQVSPAESGWFNHCWCCTFQHCTDRRGALL
jgi:hypothetical protein